MADYSEDAPRWFLPYAEQLQRIEMRVAEIATQDTNTTAEVLTRAEARRYVKRLSEGAFCRWCQRFGVKPSERGRYGRTILDLALAREGGRVRTPASLKRRR